MNRILYISIWSAIIIALVIVFGFVEKSNQQMRFLKPEIDIDYETEHRFINEDDVLTQVVSPANTNQKLLSDFNANDIEEKLKNNHAIKDAQVYKTIDGKLIVNVKQRQPIARIFSGNDSYYIDENGALMPLSYKYTARLMVVSGSLNEPYAKRYPFNYNNLEDSLATKTLLDDVFRLTSFIHKSAFWKAQIEQVAVNKVSEFELIPKVGNHKIVIGRATNLEGKFEKLMIFYKKGLAKTGWNEYTEINLKYKNQVVCKKRNN